MIQHRKTSPREEYRRQENQRIKDSASLADKFQQLKSLTVELTQFGPEGLVKTSHIKYVVNLAHAKSLFQFNCSNIECVGGDFDLSEALADAIAARERTVVGETICQGWRGKPTTERVRCRNILRYKLSLGY